MADTNERKQNENNTGGQGASNVGAVQGDTMATSLDPFGSVASAPTGRSGVNRSGVGIVDSNNASSETKQ